MTWRKGESDADLERRTLPEKRAGHSLFTFNERKGKKEQA